MRCWNTRHANPLLVVLMTCSQTSVFSLWSRIQLQHEAWSLAPKRGWKSSTSELSALPFKAVCLMQRPLNTCDWFKFNQESNQNGKVSLLATLATFLILSSHKRLSGYLLTISITTERSSRQCWRGGELFTADLWNRALGALSRWCGLTQAHRSSPPP